MSIRLTSNINSQLFNSVYKWASDLSDYHIHLNHLEYACEDKDLFVCFFDGKIAGLVQTNIKPPTVTISNFVLSPEFRRQGYGLKLLDTLEKN